MVAGDLSFRCIPAHFGAELATIEDVRASDVHPIRGESALANASHVTGSVAVMDRGAVSFCEKARRAQAAGAVALIVVNSSDDAFIIDSDGTSTDDIVLPIVCVRASDGAALRQVLPANVSLKFECSDDTHKANVLRHTVSANEIALSVVGLVGNAANANGQYAITLSRATIRSGRPVYVHTGGGGQRLNND